MRNILKEISNTNFAFEINNSSDTEQIKYLILSIWEIILMVFVVLIQYFLRPGKINLLFINDFLLGVLPNLFGAAGFVAIIFVIHRIIKRKHKDYNFLNSLLFSNLFTFLGFTLWEIIRMGLNSFDFNDIIMTVFGCVLSTILIIILFYNDSTIR